MSKCDELISNVNSLSDADLVKEFLLSEFIINIVFMHHFQDLVLVDDLGEYQDRVEKEIISRFADVVEGSCSSHVLSQFRDRLNSVLFTMEDLLEDDAQDCATGVAPAPMAGPTAGSQDGSSTE